jgi:hypothetical protein
LWPKVNKSVIGGILCTLFLHFFAAQSSVCKGKNWASGNRMNLSIFVAVLKQFFFDEKE